MGGGEPGVVRYFRADCGSWQCARCLKKRTKAIRHRFREIAEERKLTRFLTLTLDPKKLPPEALGDAAASFRYLQAVWHKFQVYIAREGLSGEFLWAREAQSSGRAHLHALVSRYLPWAKVRALWMRAGGGAAVWIERAADVHRVGAYLAKYLTAQKAASVPPGCRRFGASRGIVLWLRRGTGLFRLVDWDLLSLRRELIEEGTQVGAERLDEPDIGNDLVAFVSEPSGFIDAIPTFSWRKS